MSHHPPTDTFNFRVILKLKTSAGEEITVTSIEELVELVDLVITRRIILADVVVRTWCGAKIGWDDPLSPEQQKK